MPGKPFAKGNQLRKGTKNPNAGRKPDWFKEQMAAIACSPEAVKLVGDVVKGEPVDEFLVLQTGVQVPVKPDADTRLKFLSFASDRGMGKVVQGLEHSGEIGSRLVFIHPESK